LPASRAFDAARRAGAIPPQRPGGDGKGKGKDKKKDG
jgi:hypothetical protein